MKTLLAEAKRKFDLKFMLVGDSGSGKTHLCATYTGGPIHFYMIDPGGEKTLHKLNLNRPKDCEITIDSFSLRKNSYTDLWKQLQADEKAGFFTEMSERNGLVVLPDSLTSVNELALIEVAKKNSRTLTSDLKPMRIQDWGILIAWLKELVGVINDLPCAVVATAHLAVQTDATGTITKRYPFVNGRYASVIGSQFDEVYLLETIAKKRRIYFTEKGMFTAKSRSFECPYITDTTLDILAKAYLEGDTLASAT